MSLSQHAVRFHLHPAPTTESTPLSPCFFPFPSSRHSPSINSVLRQTCDPSKMIRGAVPLRTQEEGRLQKEEENTVSFLQLQPICSEDHFDRVLAESHQRHHPFLVVWMASWCRKCIFLKPKLEKLAVDYYPRLQFYSVDVNTVSHKLVARAGVTKMPTIQLWKDSKKQAEVIGGHKAYLVINELQEMIENECIM